MLVRRSYRRLHRMVTAGPSATEQARLDRGSTRSARRRKDSGTPRRPSNPPSVNPPGHWPVPPSTCRKPSANTRTASSPAKPCGNRHSDPRPHRQSHHDRDAARPRTNPVRRNRHRLPEGMGHPHRPPAPNLAALKPARHLTTGRPAPGSLKTRLWRQPPQLMSGRVCRLSIEWSIHRFMN